MILTTACLSGFNATSVLLVALLDRSLSVGVPFQLKCVCLWGLKVKALHSFPRHYNLCICFLKCQYISLFWGATTATHRFFYKAASVPFVLQVKERSGPSYIFLKNKPSRAAPSLMVVLKSENVNCHCRLCPSTPWMSVWIRHTLQIKPAVQALVSLASSLSLRLLRIILTVRRLLFGSLVQALNSDVLF